MTKKLANSECPMVSQLAATIAKNEQCELQSDGETVQRRSCFAGACVQSFQPTIQEAQQFASECSAQFMCYLHISVV